MVVKAALYCGKTTIAREDRMGRAYDCIDADGHILEPLTLWDDYMDPKFRDRAPKLIIDTDGKERLLIENKVLGSKKGVGLVGALGARDGIIEDDGALYREGRKGGFDPHARIPDMDLDGIDAVFLYPSLGLFAGAITDAPLAAATCRAYNRWLADYCKPYPDRLFGVAMLPLQSDEAAIEEALRRQELGMKAGFIRPNPYNNYKLHDPHYDRFWSVCEDLDLAIGIHEGQSGGMTQAGIDRFEGRGARHIVCHTLEMMLAAMSMIWGGVVERHPKLRIGFMESGGGWIAPGSTAWTATSTTRASTTRASRPGRASCSGATAGSRSSRSRAAWRTSPTTSVRTGSCGRPTIPIPTASSRARPRW